MKTVLLDRDGVINRDSDEYIKQPGEWQALTGALEAIAALTAAGFRVVVCTNQSGLARGLFDRGALGRIHARMDTQVRRTGGQLHGIFVCPHGPADGCSCRKPLPGLLRAAAAWHGFDLAGVPVVGDSGRDLDAARAGGARPILVLTGNGRRTRSEPGRADTEAYRDLLAVAERLIEEGRDG